jgi:uncharacterized protein YdcH (DUF465 family)
MNEDRLKELMLRENAEFKKLYLEHQACEKKLEVFKGQAYLTEGEKTEERELKKRKLALKDRMYLLMAEFRRRR